ncbi:hypothetical protein K501DRAFT_211100 [Backusella circina FSU 941]|nr:hypothetical protein K501DRAFT_211100 [Backusella circina FSU 941]
MSIERSIEWNQVHDKWREHYSLFGLEAKHAFNVFFDPKVFFLKENPTSGIPLSLGRLESGKYEVVMASNVCANLQKMINANLADYPAPNLDDLTPQPYEIIERHDADNPNILTKLLQKAKKKNKALQKLVVAAQEVELAKKIIADKKYVLVSIDIEAYEVDHSILLEVGWSLYDSRTEKFMDQHYLVDNYRHLTNGKFVEDCKMKFMFGTSVWCSLQQVLIELRKDLDWTVERDGGFVLVGHGLDSDITYLRKQKFMWPAPYGEETLDINSSAMIAQLNTDTIYGSTIGDLHNPPSLGRTLSLLGVDTWHLHNAGNDAHYTMLLLMLLLGKFKM